MDYQWDPRKAVANLAKHGVSFPDAVSAFADDRAITTADPHSAEERYVTDRNGRDREAPRGGLLLAVWRRSADLRTKSQSHGVVTVREWMT